MRIDSLRIGEALLELMLIGGYGSALYAGQRQQLREQLWRIRYRLNPPATAPAPATESQGRAIGPASRGRTALSRGELDHYEPHV